MGKSGTLYFPKKAFAGIGGAILVLGAISIVLGGVTLGLSISKIKRCDIDIQLSDKRGHRARPDTMLPDVPFTKCEKNLVVAIFAPSGIWNGIMFIVTGALGIAASRSRQCHRQSGLKTGFMVMCVLNATFFATTLMISSAAVPAILETMSDEVPLIHAVLGLVQGVTGFSVMMLSILGASVSCCCSPPDEEVKVILSTNSQASPPLACIDPHHDRVKLLPPDQNPDRI